MPKTENSPRARLGLKVRWTDIGDVSDLNVPVYEIFLTDGDLSRNYQVMVDIFTQSRFREAELVVHAPHGFDPQNESSFIQLCSPDQETRERSIQTIQDSLDFTREIFANYLVVHPGGMRKRPCPKEEREELRANLRDSLQALNSQKILMENMPWMYLVKEGPPLVSNILKSAEEFDSIVPLCGGICLDFSHAYLSSPQGSAETIIDFFLRHPKAVSHCHISDSKPPVGEGLQFGDGGVDFVDIFTKIKELPESNRIHSTMIPEIKSGHLEQSAGSKLGYCKLENFLRTAGWHLVER